jgi:hypothetical protein
MKKKKRSEKTIFSSIRKPIAPPTQQIGKNKPEEKANPSRRKIKHKNQTEVDD